MISNEAREKIDNLRILEQNLQNLSMQKQAFQLELNEIMNALDEVKKTSSDVYKVSSSIMFKADKNSITKELTDKKNIIELRVKTIEKQETLLESKVEEVQQEAKKLIDKK